MARAEIFALGAKPSAAKLETSRPVFEASRSAKIGSQGVDGSETLPARSPLSMIVEAFAQSSTQAPEPKAPLVPPVPSRYLTAFMLQTNPGPEKQFSNKA